MTFEEYKYAGQDCTCSAYGQHECACDADWTDPEVYRLQARIDELEAFVRDVANRNYDYPELKAQDLLAQEQE